MENGSRTVGNTIFQVGHTVALAEHHLFRLNNGYSGSWFSGLFHGANSSSMRSGIVLVYAVADTVSKALHTIRKSRTIFMNVGFDNYYTREKDVAMKYLNPFARFYLYFRTFRQKYRNRFSVERNENSVPYTFQKSTSTA